MHPLPPLIIASLFSLLGVRLLRRGSDGAGSERWLGLFFVAVAVAVPLRALSTDSGNPDAWRLSADWNLVGHAVLAVGIACFTVFVWRVFRPGERWSNALAAVMLATQAAALVAVTAFGGHRDEGHASVLAANVLRSVPFLWAFVEAVLYHRQMKKRLGLGLADPIVTNRFRLFAIWTGALFALPCVLVVVRLVVRQTGAELGSDELGWVSPLLQFSIVATGVSAFAALWLSFFPPRRYVARMLANRAAP